MELTFEEMRRHVCGDGAFRDVVTDDIRDAIRERMPAYLWIDTDDRYTGERIYRCDGCGREWTSRKHSTGWSILCKQNMEASCPACGRAVYVKSLYKGHAFKDKLNVVWYRKSAVDPQVLVAIAAHCQRDYDTDRPWAVETEIYWRGAAAFKYGEGSVRWQEKTHWNFNGSWYCTPEWKPIKTVSELTFGTESMGMFGSESPPRALLIDTLQESMHGTPFERAWHDDYLMLEYVQDGVRALDAIAKYPCIEYLTKLGMTEFLRDKLAGDLPGGLINWRGRSMEKVLGLSRQRLGELKSAKITLHPRLALVLKYCERERIRVSVRDAAALAWLLERWPVRDGSRMMDETLQFHQPNRRTKAVKYIARLARADMEAGAHRTSLRDFRDYWSQCVRLEDDMNDDAAVFPRDFHERHTRYSQRIQLMGNAEKDEQIAQRYDELNERFAFEFGGLMLRPAASSAEIIREGQVLGHCVGGYVDRYAKGDTVICVLRRTVEPDAPWRTVEISPAGGYVIQDRGYKNDGPAGILKEGRYQLMLNLFWEAWRERKKGREIA